MAGLKRTIGRMAGRVATWAASSPPAAEPPTPDAAVHGAYLHVGLDAAKFRPDLDLVSTGKLYAILDEAARRASIDHRLRTVADVTRLLDDRGHG